MARAASPEWLRGRDYGFEKGMDKGIEKGIEIGRKIGYDAGYLDCVKDYELGKAHGEYDGYREAVTKSINDMREKARAIHGIVKREHDK